MLFPANTTSPTKGSKEFLHLRVGDIDFSRHTVRVHSGKGGKDRITVLPEKLKVSLQVQIAYARKLHEQDLSQGIGTAKLPRSLQRKLGKSRKTFHWQFLFPSRSISVDPRGDPEQMYRWHVHRSCVRKAVTVAAARAGIDKRVTCHTLHQLHAVERSRFLPNDSCPAVNSESRPISKPDGLMAAKAGYVTGTIPNAVTRFQCSFRGKPSEIS